MRPYVRSVMIAGLLCAAGSPADTRAEDATAAAIAACEWESRAIAESTTGTLTDRAKQQIELFSGKCSRHPEAAARVAAITAILRAEHRKTCCARPAAP